MALHAILTAGGRLPRELGQYCDYPVKALLPFGNQTLLGLAAQAARSTPGLERVVVVGSDAVCRNLPVEAEFVQEASTVVDNIYAAYQHLGGESHDYLVISPDLPFITADALARFQAQAMQSTDIGVPWIGAEEFLAQFPGAPNRFELIDRRRMTMGSVIYMSGPIIRRNIPFWRDLYNNRKYPHRLALMLGWSVIFSLIFRRLRLEQVEQRLSRLCDGCVRAVQVQDAALAYDIDNRENYEFALRHAGLTA